MRDPKAYLVVMVAVTSCTRLGLPEPQGLVNRFRGDCRSDAVMVGNEAEIRKPGLGTRASLGQLTMRVHIPSFAGH